MAHESYRPKDFESFVREHENSVYRAADAITASHADAEDVVQVAFLCAYEKAPEFSSVEHEKAWLLRVTINLCNSLLRTPWHKRTVPLLDVYPATEQEQGYLLEQIMALPHKYRTVIHLFYYEGYSVKEIAKLTEQEESTVRSQLTRARKKLKIIIEEGA